MDKASEPPGSQITTSSLKCSRPLQMPHSTAPAVSAGVVKLYGNVRTNDKRTLAEAKITNLRGVKSITDLLTVVDRTTAPVVRLLLGDWPGHRTGSVRLLLALGCKPRLPVLLLVPTSNGPRSSVLHRQRQRPELGRHPGSRGATKSFLFDFTKGFSNCAAMSRTSWPWLRRARPRK